ncbi:MAG: hypothetical protein R3E61_11430 [Pseudomonadales bacterium]
MQSQNEDTPQPNDEQSTASSFWPWGSSERTENIKEMRKQHKLVVLLERGDLAFSKDRLNAPQHDNALLYYYTALKVDPGNNDALRRLRKVADRFRSLARTAHDNGNGKQTRTYLQQAEMITGASDPKNIRLRAELREKPAGKNSRELDKELKKKIKAKKAELKDNPLLKDKALLENMLSLPAEEQN